MRNRQTWKPSKYVYRKGKLVSSRDPEEVGVGSRLIVDLIAALYQTYLPRYAKGRLIDLGCGKVPLYAAYKDYVTDAICVDWGKTLHKNDWMDFECDLTGTLPFKDGEFDTLILSDVLEHVPQPEVLWQEMHRILAPNGTLLLNVPFFYWLHEEPNDYYRYTVHALRRFAEQSGFRIELLRPVGGSLEILTDFLAKHLQFVPLIGRGIASAIQCLTFAFGKTAVGTKLADASSKKYPLCYFMVAQER